MNKAQMREAINIATAEFLARGNHIRKLGRNARNHTESYMRKITTDEAYSLSIDADFDKQPA